jgi:hypothetical protein
MVNVIKLLVHNLQKNIYPEMKTAGLKLSKGGTIKHLLADQFFLWPAVYAAIFICNDPKNFENIFL